MKKAYQNIHTQAVDVTSPNSENQHSQREFLPRLCKPVNGSWKLMKDGVAVAEGKLELPDIAPGQSAELEVPTGHTPDP